MHDVTLILLLYYIIFSGVSLRAMQAYTVYPLRKVKDLDRIGHSITMIDCFEISTEKLKHFTLSV